MVDIEKITDKIKTYFEKSLNTDKVSVRVTKTERKDSDVVVHFKISAIFLEKEMDYVATINDSGEITELIENGSK